MNIKSKEKITLLNQISCLTVITILFKVQLGMKLKQLGIFSIKKVEIQRKLNFYFFISLSGIILHTVPDLIVK